MQEERSTLIISIVIISVFILLLISFIPFMMLLHQRRQRLLKSNHEKELLSTQLEIQEQTFQNISREIHDNIGLSLTLAKLNLNTLAWNHIEQTKEKVTNSVDFISKAIEDLSHISKTLHTDYIEDNGLLNALDLEIKKIRKLSIYKIQYDVTGSPLYMKIQKEVVIFRIIQEVLNNSIKHAQATTLRLHLNYRKKNVVIDVQDNGKGFTDQPEKQLTKKGTGLMNIVKRVQLIEGTCEIKSEPGNGTTVTMQIPY